MIQVSHLTKRYGSRLAVEDVSFQVEQGQICGLLGPNGAGKSTIMNILTGYLAPTSGSVQVAGHPLPDVRAKSCIGYLPEQPPLYPEMTVQEYLDFAARLKRVPQADRAAQILRTARRTGVESVLPRLIRNLSKGYRQRVGIAQALLGKPQLIILDEPTVGLDPAQVTEIRRLIRELAGHHTVLLSSHILSEVQAVCSQVLILSGGHLVASGTPDQLSDRLSAGVTLRVTAQGTGAEVEAALAALPGVEQVELLSQQQGESCFLVHCSGDGDHRAQVSRALAQAGCPVLELSAQHKSLEEVFLQLTGTPPETTGMEAEE